MDSGNSPKKTYEYEDRFALPFVYNNNNTKAQRSRQAESPGVQDVINENRRRNNSPTRAPRGRLANCGHYYCGRNNEEPCNEIYHGVCWGDVKLGPYCHDAGQTIDSSNRLLHRISSLYGDQDLSDIQIGVGQKVFYAHKLILCSASNVFKVMLTNHQWPESKKNSVHLKEEPQCMQVFEIFLKFMYTGVIHLTHDNVLAVLMLADKYNVCDLRDVCVSYMCNHIVTTVKQNRAVTWYQYARLCAHTELADVCSKFILCNFHKVSCTEDFLLLEKDNLLAILQESCLVIPDEFTLYKGALRWLSDLRSKCQTPSQQQEFNHVALNVLSAIRYPQIPLPRLRDLEYDPIITQFHDFFLERLNNALKYHASNSDERKQLACVSGETDQFTPRNYISDSWGTSFTIEDFQSLPQHGVRPLFFSSPISGSDADESKGMEWNVDLYPKGVQFQRCILIGLWRNLEVSGTIYNTVRLTLEAHTHKERPVDVAVLVHGTQDSVEYVRSIVQRKVLFDAHNAIVNFDDLIPYDELNMPQSPFLSGPDANSFKITIVIKPV